MQSVADAETTARAFRQVRGKNHELAERQPGGEEEDGARRRNTSPSSLRTLNDRMHDSTQEVTLNNGLRPRVARKSSAGRRGRGCVRPGSREQQWHAPEPRTGTIGRHDHPSAPKAGSSTDTRSTGNTAVAGSSANPSALAVSPRPASSAFPQEYQDRHVKRMRLDPDGDDMGELVEYGTDEVMMGTTTRVHITREGEHEAINEVDQDFHERDA